MRNPGRVNNGIYGRTKGESGRNDFISRTDVRSQHAQVECRCARVYRHCIGRSFVVAKLALQLSGFRASSKPAAPESTQYLILLFAKSFSSPTVAAIGRGKSFVSLRRSIRA